MSLIPATQRPQLRSYIFLAVAVIACLIPVSGKAFNIDDTLFLYLARQIIHHPLDPFGFKVNWYVGLVPMAQETKNPPFAGYYLAAAASVVGCSERALHLAFILPALASVWGTFRLAQKFTSPPLLAALATLLTPAFLVSSNTLMCDVMMLAFWLWAVIFWMEGLEPEKPLYLAVSALLVGLSALTKYFGLTLILLLAIYSLARLRRFGSWVWYLTLPILVLIGYEKWTRHMYGLRMISDAAHFSTGIRKARDISPLVEALVDLSFVGGCALPLLASGRSLVHRTLGISILRRGIRGARGGNQRLAVASGRCSGLGQSAADVRNAARVYNFASDH